MSGDNRELFDKLAKLIEDANKNQTIELKKELQVEVSGIKNEIADIKKLIAEESYKRNQLEERQLCLENKHQHIEKLIKKNNILIFGLKEENVTNLAESTIFKLNSLLELNLTVSTINNIFYLGKRSGSPILVQFISFLTKLQVLKSCRKLKGTGISISDDLTTEEREIRKVLVNHKKWAQKEGHTAYIRNNKLHVGKEIYTYEDLKENSTENPTKGNKCASSSRNRQSASAPVTPIHSKEYETDSDIDSIEVDIEENEDGEKEPIKIDVNTGESKKIKSINIEQKQNTNQKTLKEKSPIKNLYPKKRKSEATHAVGPITRRFKRIHKKASPKRKPTKQQSQLLENP